MQVLNERFEKNTAQLLGKLVYTDPEIQYWVSSLTRTGPAVEELLTSFLVRGSLCTE